MPVPFGHQDTVIEVGSVREMTEPGTDRTIGSTSTLRKDRDRAELSWRDLRVEVDAQDGKKELLKGLTGSAKPGQLVALMGPSGAGKTCFLNALAGRSPGVRVTGEVCVNGSLAEAEARRASSAYVMQEDALLVTQTPRELLHFAAALKLGILDESDRTGVVDATLDILGLDSCADNPVGSQITNSTKGRVSGGEKKRAAIGQELLSSPGLVFLDEPTSGLDSYSAMQLVLTLRRLARDGCTVITTIHQPSSEVFELFDRVLLLSSGRVVYDGSVEDIDGHFTALGHPMPPHSNPADFAILRLQEMEESELGTCGRPEDIPVATKKLDVPDRSSASNFAQLRWLLHRDVVHVFRDPSGLQARMIQVLFLNLIGGCIYMGTGSSWGADGDEPGISTAVNDHFGGLFYFALSLLFANAQPPLIAFIPERPVFVREYAAGTYGVGPYMLTKILSDLPVSVVAVVMAQLIMYFMADWQGNFFVMLAYGLVISLAGSSLSLCLGTIAPDAQTAVSLLPLSIVPQFLLAGFFTPGEAMPVWIRWAQYTCSMKFGMNLFLAAEFTSDNVPANRVQYADALLDRNGVETDSATTAMYISILIGVFVVGMRFIALLLLRRLAMRSLE